MSIEERSFVDPYAVVEDPNFLRLTVQGRALAKFAHATLDRHFRGWRWGVTVNEEGGVLHVFAMELSSELGYTVLLDDFYNDGNFDWKLILVAGGEILERFGQPRGMKKPGWEENCRWLNGLAIPDVSDKKREYIKHMGRRLGIYNGQPKPI